MLTPAQQNEISKKLRFPRALIKIEYADGIIRFATGGNRIWDGQNWLKSGITVKSLKTGKGGIQTARFSIINNNNLYSELAILGKLNFAKVTYWQYYGANPALEDPIKRFYGEIIKVPSIASEIVIDCATIGGITKRLPNYSAGSPDINHMPYSGQRVVIGNSVYIVEIT